MHPFRDRIGSDDMPRGSCLVKVLDSTLYACCKIFCDLFGMDVYPVLPALVYTYLVLGMMPLEFFFENTFK